ncbi:MAG: HEAT repeat domain-containing protein [Cyanobacteria bacterium J007]|nr:MAG: HEAT repeat domain-containing protein [Cyanobacteria bacterium J007]
MTVADSSLKDRLTRLDRAITPPERIAAIAELVEGVKNDPGTAVDEAIAALIAQLEQHHPGVAKAAVDGLVEVGAESVEGAIAAYHRCTDQMVQAYLIQGLARIGDPRAIDLLVEVVGVEMANHCQGNVRRVAARGLGQVGCNSDDPAIVGAAIDKLTWALMYTEDWALRYAACVSLSEIGTDKAAGALHEAIARERDPVVVARLREAISPAG